LFANSPFTEGRPNGFISFRSHIWSDTDKDRTGMLPFVFENGFGYERYLDYALDVPMYFVFRDGRYIDASGQSFRDFLDGRLAALPGEKPLVSDFTDHLSTIFPEVRLKSFLEMRGADGGRWSRICALPAFWVGLLYDDSALNAAWDEVKNWSLEARQQLRDSVPKMGLRAITPDGESLRELGDRILAISEAGLKARARLNASGDNESGFLDPLREVIASGMTPADRLLERYNGVWKQDLSRVYQEESF
jgi:glutamate--cysteine ligase